MKSTKSEDVVHYRVKTSGSKCENPEDESPVIKSPIKAASAKTDVVAPKQQHTSKSKITFTTAEYLEFKGDIQMEEEKDQVRVIDISSKSTLPQVE